MTIIIMLTKKVNLQTHIDFMLLLLLQLINFVGNKYKWILLIEKKVTMYVFI